MISKYIFVIDTNKHAGNFERQMCAYITGQIGDCKVGEEMANLAKKELSKEQYDLFNDIITNISDDHGFYSPCSIWLSPNLEKELKKDIAKFNYYICEARNGRQVLNWTIDECEKKIKELGIRIKKNSSLKGAYNSVAISFIEKPNFELINLMKERAHKFAEAYRKHSKYRELYGDFQLDIESFRIICEKTELI